MLCFVRRLAAIVLATLSLACGAATNYLDPTGPMYEARHAAPVPEAPAEGRLRVVTFNIAYAIHVDRAIAVLQTPGPLERPDLLALQEMDALRRAVEQRCSPGEPRSIPGMPIARLDVRKFQGRRWATRARPGVDRMACVWLIRRFIDPAAQFLWLADPAQAPRGALGFDFDGARFTHAGVRVSFEVLVASFGLDADPALARLGLAVRYLDAGGIPVPEAAGLAAVLSGLREVHADDDRLVAAAAAVFDALHAAPGFQP